jgi:hypothetical protein
MKIESISMNYSNASEGNKLSSNLFDPKWCYLAFVENMENFIHDGVSMHR